MKTIKSLNRQEMKNIFGGLLMCPGAGTLCRVNSDDCEGMVCEPISHSLGICVAP